MERHHHIASPEMAQDAFESRFFGTIINNTSVAEKVLETYACSDLLDPLVDFGPRPITPKETLLEIQSCYGWSPEQIVHVLIDIANSETDGEPTNDFEPVELSGIHAPHLKVTDHIVVRSGTKIPGRIFHDRPKPDFVTTEELSEEDEAFCKARVAKDLVSYLLGGIDEHDLRNPDILNQVTQNCMPFKSYGARMKTLAALCKHYAQLRAKPTAKWQSVKAILDEDNGIRQLFVDGNKSPLDSYYSESSPQSVLFSPGSKVLSNGHMSHDPDATAALRHYVKWAQHELRANRRRKYTGDPYYTKWLPGKSTKTV